MKNIKIMIIFLIIVIILITALLLYLLTNHDEVNNTINTNIGEGNLTEENLNTSLNGGDQILIDTEVQDVNSATMYYTVQNCIQKYLTIASLNLDKNHQENIVDEDLLNALNIQTSQQKAQAIYDLLSSEYINQNNITVNNLYAKVNTYNQSRTFKAKEMKMIHQKNLQIYFIKGNIYYTQTMNLDEVSYFIVKIDNSQVTFSIEPLNASQYENRAKEYIGKEEGNINRNTQNVFSYYRIKDDQIATNYLSNYKEEALQYTQQAFETLDKEYREKRFGNLEEYKNYIEENREAIEKIQLSRYTVSGEGSSKVYTCIDQYNNYYIFNQKAIMKYTLKLDTYTIMSDEFQSEYNASSNERKVLMNISKFIKMINAKDYINSYKLLPQSFKNNYFPTIEQYKDYIKKNFFEYNNIEYDDLEKQDDIYIYKIKLTDITNQQNNIIEKNMIVKLGEDYNFVMSFNI